MTLHVRACRPTSPQLQAADWPTEIVMKHNEQEERFANENQMPNCGYLQRARLDSKRFDYRAPGSLQRWGGKARPSYLEVIEPMARRHCAL